MSLGNEFGQHRFGVFAAIGMFSLLRDCHGASCSEALLHCQLMLHTVSRDLRETTGNSKASPVETSPPPPFATYFQKPEVNKEPSAVTTDSNSAQPGDNRSNGSLEYARSATPRKRSGGSGSDGGSGSADESRCVCRLTLTLVARDKIRSANRVKWEMCTWYTDLFKSFSFHSEESKASGSEYKSGSGSSSDSSHSGSSSRSASESEESDSQSEVDVEKGDDVKPSKVGGYSLLLDDRQNHFYTDRQLAKVTSHLPRFIQLLLSWWNLVELVDVLFSLCLYSCSTSWMCLSHVDIILVRMGSVCWSNR